MQRERCRITPCLLFEELTANRLLDLGWGEASLVHLTGASRDYGDQSMWESIVGTTAVVAGVARGAGLRKIVYLSGYGVSPDSTEPYFRAKCCAEALIGATAIPHTIFRSSYILGHGDELVPQLIARLRQGYVEVPGSGLYRMQPLHVADVVPVLMAAVEEAPNDNRIVPLLGEPIAYIDFVKSLARSVAPGAKIVTVELEDFIRRIRRSSDPDLSMSELGVLICDCVGPSTVNCLGKTLPDLRNVMERVVALYVDD